MTYDEAYDELSHMFPDVLPHPAMSPKRLLTLMQTVADAVTQFDAEAT
jgi:hypothetical protein